MDRRASECQTSICRIWPRVPEPSKVLVQGTLWWAGSCAQCPVPRGFPQPARKWCLGGGGGGSRIRLEPSPADHFSMEHFWLCRSSPCGSRLTFAEGGKLIHGARFVGCSLPQGHRFSSVMPMLCASLYFQMKNEHKEYAVSIDSLNLHIWVYMFDVCLLCVAVCQTWQDLFFKPGGEFCPVHLK